MSLDDGVSLATIELPPLPSGSLGAILISFRTANHFLRISPTSSRSRPRYFKLLYDQLLAKLFNRMSNPVLLMSIRYTYHCKINDSLDRTNSFTEKYSGLSEPNNELVESIRRIVLSNRLIVRQPPNILATKRIVWKACYRTPGWLNQLFFYRVNNCS